MLRVAQVLAVLVLLVSACGDVTDTNATAPAGDTATSTSTTSTTSTTTTTTSPEMPTGVPEPGATFTGPFEAQPGLTGTITFEISVSGDQVVSILGMGVEFLADDYQCDGSTVSGGFSRFFVFTYDPVLIRDGAFGVDLSGLKLKWHGTFDSTTTAQGTFWHIDRGCEYGPMPWDADSR